MEPQKGDVQFRGESVAHVEPHEIVRRGISLVPEGREVFHDLTVRENLMLGSYLRRDRSEIQRDLAAVHDYFPVLREREGQLAGSLSGGEQQMLAIARALMARPALLLMDEPSLGLSPLLVREIFRIIKRINEEQDTAILMVEQNARMALSLAHYGYILETGRIVMADTGRNLMDNEDVKEFYLGIKEQGIRASKRWRRKKKWR
jgi:branched-chain amino acid transport system ATP-binding protein